MYATTLVRSCYCFVMPCNNVSINEKFQAHKSMNCIIFITVKVHWSENPHSIGQILGIKVIRLDRCHKSSLMMLMMTKHYLIKAQHFQQQFHRILLKSGSKKTMFESVWINKNTTDKHMCNCMMNISCSRIAIIQSCINLRFTYWFLMQKIKICAWIQN